MKTKNEMVLTFGYIGVDKYGVHTGSLQNPHFDPECSWNHSPSHILLTTMSKKEMWKEVREIACLWEADVKIGSEIWVVS